MKKMYGVIGDPIAHSMSPAMQGDLFVHYGMDAVYLPFHVKANQLQDAVDGFRALGAGGFNVTVPHKTAIMPLLDKIDSLAQNIGAVNTVVNEDGLLVGYNTDGMGYVKSLSAKMDSLENKRVLMIGAGGAARAIYFSLAAAGLSEIDICNRTLTKAALLADSCPFPVKTSVLTLLDGQEALGSYDLIIQTTSIGMSPASDDSPISMAGLKQGAFVSDIVYNPLKTKLLADAENNGAAVQNGVDMFVFQGALAFEKWTGIFPDTERMKKIVMKHLGGITC